MLPAVRDRSHVGGVRGGDARDAPRSDGSSVGGSGGAVRGAEASSSGVRRLALLSPGSLLSQRQSKRLFQNRFGLFRFLPPSPVLLFYVL